MHRFPCIAWAAGCCAVLVHGGPPAYTIVDLGVAECDHVGSQAFGISPGGVVTGRSLGAFGTGDVAFMWTQVAGLVALPSMASPPAPFSIGYAVNDAGVVVGVASIDASGAKPIPVMWSGGAATSLPLPRGETLGRAFSVNAAGVVVGSVGSIAEVGAIFENGVATIIETTTRSGAFLQTANGINDAGRIVGTGAHRGNVRGFAMFPQPPTCEGDLNHDDMVDGVDLGILVAGWGTVVRGVAQDLNGDGEVNGVDLGVLLAAWGGCPR